MKFRTEIEISHFEPRAQIDYSNRILALGSCFAAEMTARLHYLRFRCTTNPTGVLFNPISIAAAIHRFAAPQSTDSLELFNSGGLWCNFEFHGSFSDPEPNTARARMNAAQDTARKALHGADRVILTFGSAWVYEHYGNVVANCHRRPAAEFTRRRLSVAEITDCYSELLAGPLAGCEVILTVSPVRHLGDGLEGNALSKAILRIAAAELAEQYAQVHYFPAYEILTDDLRDYRFYADDLVHPAQQAIEYIWEKFSQAVLNDSTQQVTQAANEIIAAANHRPMHPRSEAFRTFCRTQLMRIAAMPEINFAEESARFEKYLQ